MSRIRKLGPVVCAALLAEGMVFFQGCGSPPLPNLAAYATNPAGQNVCILQTYVPPSLKRATPVDYGLQVVVPLYQVADIEVYQDLRNLTQAANPPSSATGDFTLNWALRVPGQPVLCHYWWYTDTNIGYRGVGTYTSQGTFTPTQHSGCAQAACTTSGSLITNIQVECKSVGGVPYTPGTAWTQIAIVP